MNRRTFLQSAAMSALAVSSLPALGQVRRFGSEGQMPGATGQDIRIALIPGMTGRIGEAFCGFSYEKSQVALPMFTGENHDLIGLYLRLGPGVLRLGGNSVDWTMWDRFGTGRADGKIAPADVDGVAEFARATGWKVLYGVNLAQSTPALAADEVAYATRAFGSSLAGIEIGNEPDCFVGAKYFPNTWKYTDYIARWRTFADAILQRAPNSLLTGPATGYNVNWFKSFAADAPKQVRLLTHHYYRANGQLPTSDIKLLVSYPDANLIKQLAQVRDVAIAANLPFRFAETNSYYNGGSPNISDSYASALWVIDYLFTLAANGCAGANFHGGGNSPGYTPIADVRGKMVGPRPEYYGIYLFTLAGEGELHACQCNSLGLNLTAYAVERKNGGLNVIIVNKEQRSLSIAFDLTSFGHDRKLHSASATLMTNTSLFATSGTTIGGSAISVDGEIAPRKSERLAVANGHFGCTMPPISAALLKLS